MNRSVSYMFKYLLIMTEGSFIICHNLGFFSKMNPYNSRVTFFKTGILSISFQK